MRPLCDHVSGPYLLLSFNFFVCENGGDIVNVLWVWHDDNIKHLLWTLPFSKRLPTSASSLPKERVELSA